MDPAILEWSKTPEAQPYMQKAMGMLMGSTPGDSSLGEGDLYGKYLQTLITSNSQNPQFQNQMLGYYLDYINPVNQRQWGMDENKLNIGLSLLSAEDENLQRAGLSLISEAYPTLNEYMDISGYAGGIPQTYEGTIRQQARENLKNTEGMTQEEFEWNSFLANATDEQIRAYNTANPSFREAWEAGDVNSIKNVLSSAGTGAAAGAALGSIVPVVGTGFGALVGGAGGSLYGAAKTALDYISGQEEARRRAAGYYGGYGQ